MTDETWQNDTGKRWKAIETENTRIDKNLKPEFLEPPYNAFFGNAIAVLCSFWVKNNVQFLPLYEEN